MTTLDALLIVSILANIGLVGALAYLARRKRQNLDITAQKLLFDLSRHGAAVLKVEVLDPANLILRSPRL